MIPSVPSNTVQYPSSLSDRLVDHHGSGPEHVAAIAEIWGSGRYCISAFFPISTLGLQHKKFIRLYHIDQPVALICGRHIQIRDNEVLEVRARKTPLSPAAQQIHPPLRSFTCPPTDHADSRPANL